jgi:hypothetical protein
MQADVCDGRAMGDHGVQCAVCEQQSFVMHNIARDGGSMAIDDRNDVSCFCLPLLSYLL